MCPSASSRNERAGNNFPRQIPRNTLFLKGSVPFLLAVMLLARLAPASHEAAWEEDWWLYKRRCALCHYISRPDAKFAPSLKDLFERRTLMDGKPVNDQNVSEWIANGSPNMPGFRYSLDQREIQLLVRFLKEGPWDGFPE